MISKEKKEQVEDTIEWLVNREIYGSATVLADFAIKMAQYGVDKSIELPFLPEDIDAIMTPICPKCAGHCTAYDDKAEDGYFCFDCDTHFEDSDDYPEIFEWWGVSDYLWEHLKRYHEKTLCDGYNYYWGRCTTGQPIAEDWVIQKIALDICNRVGTRKSDEVIRLNEQQQE